MNCGKVRKREKKKTVISVFYLPASLPALISGRGVRLISSATVKRREENRGGDRRKRREGHKHLGFG